VIIEQTCSPAIINHVFKEPQVWQEICGIYGGIIEEFEPILENHLYLVGYDKLDIIGIFQIHDSEYGKQCHVQVMPEHRKQHAAEFGEKVLQWTWNNTDINTLTALIPNHFTNVIAFAELNGFEVIGSKDDNAIMKIER